MNVHEAHHKRGTKEDKDGYYVAHQRGNILITTFSRQYKPIDINIIYVIVYAYLQRHSSSAMANERYITDGGRGGGGEEKEDELVYLEDENQAYISSGLRSKGST